MGDSSQDVFCAVNFLLARFTIRIRPILPSFSAEPAKRELEYFRF